MSTAATRSAIAPRPLRRFWCYRLTDGALTGGMGGTDHPGFEENVRAGAAEHGEGVIEHDGDLDLSYDRVDAATGKLVDPVDYAFAADLDEKWQSVLRCFPGLANPVPPAPVPKSPGGEQRFSVSAFWQDFTQRAAAGEWKLRAPCDELARLVGPLVGHGTCLEPVFREGRIGYYDTMLPAQDGDVVLVRLDSLECQRIHERGRDRPAWVAMYGNPNPLCTKLLKAFGREYWLVTNDSMFRLGKNTILGVLRHCLVDGAPAYTVPNIGPNAATEIYTGTFAGPTTYAANSGTYTPCSASFTAGDDTASQLAQATATFDASVDIAGSQNQVQLRLSGAATQSGLTFQTDLRRFTLMAVASFAAGATVTAEIFVDTSAGVAVTLARAQVRLELVKR